ncbi:hypothetical protein Tcan_14813, partial [Toxocara canis]
PNSTRAPRAHLTPLIASHTALRSLPFSLVSCRPGSRGCTERGDQIRLSTAMSIECDDQTNTALLVFFFCFLNALNQFAIVLSRIKAPIDIFPLSSSVSFLYKYAEKNSLTPSKILQFPH